MVIAANPKRFGGSLSSDADVGLDERQTILRVLAQLNPRPGPGTLSRPISAISSQTCLSPMPRAREPQNSGLPLVRNLRHLRPSGTRML